ncbi:MAG: hypothetical protein H7645_07615 [Candidatus Heimdallarchaeota archaeon]|nr:hypothetical protein [Candidatus Heimdallarchaeota archaeon]MCK4770191.1 hypothetical protein [Candidatus Heimdallarchaeota archaeon]
MVVSVSILGNSSFSTSLAMCEGVSSGTLNSELVSPINFGASQIEKPRTISYKTIITILYFLIN